MDDRQFLDVISGRRSGAVAGLMRAGLSIVTPFYRLVIEARNALFDAGLKRLHRLSVPVVSVGNITTGGTGKTPLVAWLAEWFTTRGKRPAIVSRGYRTLDERGNDEQRVLEQLCRGVPQEHDPDRVAAARRVVEAHAADVVILDDGFQHRRLARDLDIVLVDALNPWGYGRLLPRGLLREPKSSLKRADAIIITRIDQCSEAELSRLRTQIGRYTPAPMAEVAFRPRRLQSLDGQTAELNALQGKNLFGFCGIGNPDSFRRTLAGCGFAADDVPLEVFPDHHHYTADDVRRLKENADAPRADAFVTTQKDLVKLDPGWFDGRPVWAVVIGAEFRQGERQISELLINVIGETALRLDG